MNKQELKESLSYDLLVFADVASVSYSPTAVYKLLQSVRKDVFANNERIVFYGNYPDAELVNHVTKARELLDIGEFFVEYYFDIVDADIPGTGFKVNSDTLCTLLWSHLEVRHNGNVYPCCVSSVPVGNANENTLTEIFNNSNMDLLRKQLITGGRPHGCDHCWRLEKQGISSNRQWHVAHNSINFYTNWHDNPTIRSLDLKPSNVCNFKCRTCNGTYSSSIADEVRRHSTIPIVSERWEEYSEYVWGELDTLLPDIENIDFFGGEPFLVKEVKTFLRNAVITGDNSHMRIHFNTNGSIFPTDMIDTLKQFKDVDIAVSIDDIGDRFELTRGGVWKEVEANILKFKELGFDVYIFPTVNIQNVLYLDELLVWADSHKIRYVLNFLEAPQYLNIDSMTATAKELVVAKYQDSPNDQLQALANRVRVSSGSDGVIFVKKMKYLDGIRNQNFASTHNKIAQAMGYDLLSL